MSSLIDLQKSYFLQFFKSFKEQHKVLILDNVTEELVFSILSKTELLRIFSVVSTIDEKRSTQVSLNAVYLLEPTRYSVQCLLADYEVVPMRYKGAHVYFLPALSPELMESLKSNQQLISRLLSLAEFPVDLFAKEPRVFTLRNPQSLQTYYNECCTDLVMKNVRKVASSLVGLCVLTGEYPVIRYYSPIDPKFNAVVLPKMIANELQLQLDEYARKNSDFPPQTERPRSIFIVTDRTCDLFSPLLHEFTYQAMAYDLLPIDQNDVYDYKVENESGTLDNKQAKLDENDSEWLRLRELHISDAGDSWKLAFKEFTSKYGKFINRTGKMSVSDLSTLAAGTDDFNEARRKIALHDTIINALSKINNDRNLVELAEFEQDLVNNGVGMGGERLKNLALVLLSLLSNEKPDFNDKIRVILIYAIYRGGLIEKDYIKLLHFMDIPGHKIPDTLDYFRNFSRLGFQLVKPDLKSKSVTKREFFHESLTGEVFNTSRFKPAMSTIISQLPENTLDETVFPYIKDKPIDVIAPTQQSASLKNPRHRAAWGKSSQVYESPKQRIFYYIAGGLTYSEVRTAYELGSKLDKHVFLGSDELMRPVQFLEDVKNLSNSNRSELNLAQDWKQRASNQPVPKHLYESDKPTSRSVTPQPHQSPNSQSAPSVPASTSSLSDTALSCEKESKRSRFKKFLKG